VRSRSLIGSLSQENNFTADTMMVMPVMMSMLPPPQTADRRQLLHQERRETARHRPSLVSI
jgi:hypothetical protein